MADESPRSASMSRADRAAQRAPGRPAGRPGAFRLPPGAAVPAALGAVDRHPEDRLLRGPGGERCRGRAADGSLHLSPAELPAKREGADAVRRQPHVRGGHVVPRPWHHGLALRDRRLPVRATRRGGCRGVFGAGVLPGRGTSSHCVAEGLRTTPMPTRHHPSERSGASVASRGAGVSPAGVLQAGPAGSPYADRA